ncbi:MAG: penicillin-insensitive murein endopeptidase [Myxococcota bacterium]
MEGRQERVGGDRSLMQACVACACLIACSGAPSSNEPAAEPASPASATAEAIEAPEVAEGPPAPIEAVEAPEPEPAIAPEVAAILAPDAERSVSVGGPNDGRVERAVAMPDEGPGFRFNERRPTIARYGTGRMVRALIRAAMDVHESHGGEATFNDLGLERGGAIAHHGSHRAGRDVDVLFYLTHEGEPHRSVGAFLDPEGFGVDFRDLADPADDIHFRIDLPRTRAFVHALLRRSDEEDLPVQRIFVVEHVRSMLIAHARSAGGDEAMIERFAMVTCQPGAPHDDHFHIRFFCAGDDIAQGCTDARPHYPWWEQALAERGLELRVHVPRRDRPMAEITTAAQARRRAGALAPEVREWLNRRRAWQRKPHPGRRWCR